MFRSGLLVCALLVGCGGSSGDVDRNGDGFDCDDGDAGTGGVDADGDGMPSCVDCDDSDPLVYPGRSEICSGVDDNCDGVVDRDEGGVGICEVRLIHDAAVDVLLVVDNSPSMSQEQSALNAHFVSVYEALSVDDFHIGVLSTDMRSEYAGMLRTSAGVRWVEPSTPNPTTVIGSMMVMGTSGSPDIRGLDAVYWSVLHEGQAGGYNSGFLRPNANLDVVFISDSDDASSTFGTESKNWFATI